MTGNAGGGLVGFNNSAFGVDQQVSVDRGLAGRFVAPVQRRLGQQRLGLQGAPEQCGAGQQQQHRDKAYGHDAYGQCAHRLIDFIDIDLDDHMPVSARHRSGSTEHGHAAIVHFVARGPEFAPDGPRREKVRLCHWLAFA